MGPLFVLVHSPLVGPSTWSLVADELPRRGYDVLVLAMANPTEAPFWSRHVDSVVNALADYPTTEPVILIGHSGAGPLLPAIGRSAARRVAAYIFVDAGLPIDGESRMGTGDFAAYLRDLYARGERFPNWSEDDLLDEVPDPVLRARVLAELRPQPLAFWEESLPMIEGWSRTPGAFLQFTSTYDVPAEQAQLLGWPYHHLDGSHFHMLVHPAVFGRVAVRIFGMLTCQHVNGERTGFISRIVVMIVGRFSWQHDEWNNLKWHSKREHGSKFIKISKKRCVSGRCRTSTSSHNTRGGRQHRFVGTQRSVPLR